MKYYLQNDHISIVVDTLGAYIDSLKYKGESVFFNKTVIDDEGRSLDRGGCHICYPQFSSGDKFGLEKHGFGRKLEWGVIDNSESHIILELTKATGDYEKLLTKLFYTLDGNKIVMKLLVSNKGDGKVALAPAFHPYFEIGDANEVLLDGEVLDLNDETLIDTWYKNNVKNLKTDKYEVEFEQKNLSVYALWTDRMGSYFCAEPTHSSISFTKDEGYIMIDPGSTREFVFEMKIK